MGCSATTRKARTDRQLKGVGADGQFLTAATENYSSGTNRHEPAGGVQWFLSGTVAGVCESEYTGVTPTMRNASAAASAAHREPTPTPAHAAPAPEPDPDDPKPSPAPAPNPEPPAFQRGAGVGPHHTGLRRRDVVATAEDFDAFVVGDAGSFGFVAGIIRGKHLARHAVTHHLLHTAFDHSEARVLHFLCDALSDAEPWWATVVEETPCDACITGDASRFGASGPRS